MKITYNNTEVTASSKTFELADFRLDFQLSLKKINTKGRIVYEYNPFRNYRLPDGTLNDFDTEELGFDINNPVSILTQPSYDGSVNLILNDNKNIPRLINSRFSVRELNTYEIVDRSGSNDTNIYDQGEQFNIDTSLYKRTTTIPKLDFGGVFPGGDLDVGNYVFYFKFSDADGNETDFVAESGIVSVFIGTSPQSIRSGLRNENSHKYAQFVLRNIDSAYNYVTVYYTKSTSDANQSEVTSAHKIDKKYLIRGDASVILINGSENVIDISLDDINMQYNIVDRVKAQAACQNMLFLGNVNKPKIDYTELADLSLRFTPYLNTSKKIEDVGTSYDTAAGYYNPNNIYHFLGYWNNEIYRLGIVYILKDNSLSPVFNIRGRDEIPTYTQGLYTDTPLYDAQGKRNYISINESDYTISSNGYIENAMGVCRFVNETDTNTDKIAYGIDIRIMQESNEVMEELKKHIKGFFFVRQKRIPTILCQALTIGLDRQSHLPTVPVNLEKVTNRSLTSEEKLENFILERFINDDRILDSDYVSRLYKIKKSGILQKAAICPEYELRAPYFNQLFTGEDFPVGEADCQPTEEYFDCEYINNRHLYIPAYKSNIGEAKNLSHKVNIIAVGDDVELVSNGNQKFSSRAGSAEEAYKFEYAYKENKVKTASNLIRGAYGPYLGIDNFERVMKLINIYIPEYDVGKNKTYFDVRYSDKSSYYAISDRIDIEEFNNSVTCYRGDCYICQYTHRMNRNFQDPSAPTNDDVVDIHTWKDNYDVNNSETNGKINRGDVNAIQLGHWVTFKVRSSINLSIRDLDYSYPAEEGLVGHPRVFYPLYAQNIEGSYKTPESFVINAGISSTTSDKYYFELPNVPYIKNNYETRILYSNIHVTDAFKNGFREFKFTNYRDYPKTYGSIIKMVELFGNILCVFEHGVALIPVNERVEAGDGVGGSVFINTSNVLPENPRVLSDTFGTQWPESVVKTPYFVYGVDTVGRKVWRTNGQEFEIISDFKIQEFLNNNITLTERELTPIIGIRNVKTHYNRFKQDVMFTFYDNLYGFEEKVWNICYNEILQKWMTFYSWVPSYSENIDNMYFSFDRNTSKQAAKMWTSTHGEYIYTDTFLIEDDSPVNLFFREDKKPSTFELTVKFSIERDNLGNYKRLILDGDIIKYNTTEYGKPDGIYLLNVRANLEYPTGGSPAIQEYIDSYKNYATVNAGYYDLVIALCTKEYRDNLTTSFWKHGTAGIIDIADTLKPCMWYGKQHPFEFEVVVLDNPSVHKIFENLVVLSNNVAPESFHYEITGDVYDFADDRRNMYFRQEATKNLYQYNGSDILFNKNYLKVKPKQRDILGSTSPYKDRSTMFPLYYTRVDTVNEIEDYYQAATAPNKDYQSLSGSEIIYNEKLDSFKILTHVKGCPFKGFYKQRCKDTDPGAIIDDSVPYPYVWAQYGRLRGNMDFIEDNWYVQIPSINFYQKNELQWKVGKEGAWYPPLNLVNNPLPSDMSILEIKDKSDIPEDLVRLGYDVNADSFDTTKWETITNHRKESKIKDKVMKVKIRYTGNELVYITALKTIYNISYA